MSGTFIPRPAELRLTLEGTHVFTAKVTNDLARSFVRTYRSLKALGEVDRPRDLVELMCARLREQVIDRFLSVGDSGVDIEVAWSVVQRINGEFHGMADSRLWSDPDQALATFREHYPNAELRAIPALVPGRYIDAADEAP
jgi:hypothetical protein